jgi:hypothetical protein
LYVAISSRICRERWLANCVSQARFDVRDADFTNMETLFEPPTDDERPVIYDQPQPRDSWLAAHFGATTG